LQRPSFRGLKVSHGWRVQPVDATVWLNISAAAVAAPGARIRARFVGLGDIQLPIEVTRTGARVARPQWTGVDINTYKGNQFKLDASWSA